MMKSLSPVTLGVTMLSLVAGTSAQRSEKSPADEQSPMQEHVALSDLVGAEVRLEPSRDAKEEARRENEKADRPTGEVEDLVLTRDGQVRFAIVGVGGILGMGEKTVAIPYSKLHYGRHAEEDEHVFDLKMTQTELKAQPDFDKEKAKQRGLGRVLGDTGAAEASGKRQDARGDRTEPAKATGRAADATGMMATLMMASDLRGCSVRTKDAELGSIEEGVVSIDRKGHCVDFVIVDGDESYLVPMKALERVERDGEPALRLNKSQAEMKSAPKYTDPESEQEVLDSKDAERARAFYGVSSDDRKRK